MKPRRSLVLVATLSVMAAFVAGLDGSAQGQPTPTVALAATTPQGIAAIPSGKGRIYVFRTVRSSGAHIDDSVTINGVAVQRVSPGNGFYCDVTSGTYVIDLSHRKTRPLNVTIAAGQQEYVRLMLHHSGGATPRRGAPTSDQSFDIRLLDPGYGAQRVQEYHLTPANCQP